MTQAIVVGFSAFGAMVAAAAGVLWYTASMAFGKLGSFAVRSMVTPSRVQSESFATASSACVSFKISAMTPWWYAVGYAARLPRVPPLENAGG